MTSSGHLTAEGFVTGSRLLQAVRSTVASGPADVAVAYWGPKAVDLLEIPADARGIRVACDAFSGSCSPKALAELLRRGARIYDSPGLHAKVFHGGGTLVVGSANASANGFGQDVPADGLDLEAASVSHRAEDLAAAAKWLARVFREGIALTKADLPRVREARDSRPAAPPKPRFPSFLRMLAEDPGWFAGRRLRVCMYDLAEPSAAIQKAYKGSEFYKGRKAVPDVDWLYYWSTEDWDVAEGDLILDFERDRKRGKIDCTGVWRVLGRVGDGITAVEYVPKPLGLAFSETDIGNLGKAVTRNDVFSDDHRYKLLDIVPWARDLKRGFGAKVDPGRGGRACLGPGTRREHGRLSPLDADER